MGPAATRRQITRRDVKVRLEGEAVYTRLATGAFMAMSVSDRAAKTTSPWALVNNIHTHYIIAMGLQ